MKTGFHVGNARATTYPSEAFVYFALGHLMAHEIHKAYIAERIVQLLGDSLFVCFKAIEERTEVHQRHWRVRASLMALRVVIEIDDGRARTTTNV